MTLITQDQLLEKCVDTTQVPHVANTNKVLWREFETVFKSAWQDSLKNTNAYDQLMKLKMKDLDVDVDTYIAMFERLVTTAEREPDAKATIAQFCLGLQDSIHCCIIGQENWLANMAE